MRMKAFLVKGVFMFAALTSIFIGISDAQVSVASFNDSRCAAEMVCPNDPLLFTCTVTESGSGLAQVTLPSGVVVEVTSMNMTVVGATPLPAGVTVQSHNAIVVGELANYTLTLAIERASLLGGDPVVCDDRTLSPLTDSASCPIATDPPGPPESLGQVVSANTETSAVVQWGSPAMTGGNGVTISDYRVTVVDGGMNQTVSHDDSGGVFTATVTVLFNTNYSVSVTAINSCGLSSQPATTTVFIEARLPPRPQNVSLSMECSVSDVRSVNISWMDGEREVGIVYPGEKAIVVLTPDNIDCTVADSTSCTASFTMDRNYTFNLTLNNEIGSSEPVIHSFNSMALLTEESLRGSEPSVTVTVNENCSNAYSYDVSVSFGVREKDSNGDCGFKDVVTENISPMESETFKVNKTNVLLIDSQEYCFDVSFQETTIPPPSVTTVTEALTIAEKAGIAIGAVGGVSINVVIVFIIGFFFYRKMKKRPQSDQEMKHLSSSASDPGSPVARDAAAVSSETGEVLYTEVDPNSRNRTTEQVQPGPVFQDPTSIEHQEGPSGDLYAMPQTSGKKGKKEKKKGKGREEEAEQQEMTEEEKAALYSVPDKKAQKAKSQGLTYADIDIQRSTKPAPPSQGSYYADIKL